MILKAKLTTHERKEVGEARPKCKQNLKFRLSTGGFLGVSPQAQGLPANSESGRAGRAKCVNKFLPTFAQNQESCSNS